MLLFFGKHNDLNFHNSSVLKFTHYVTTVASGREITSILTGTCSVLRERAATTRNPLTEAWTKTTKKEGQGFEAISFLMRWGGVRARKEEFSTLPDSPSVACIQFNPQAFCEA